MASKIQAVNKVSSRTCFTGNPPCCTSPQRNYFATIFSELFVGGCFMASELAESVARWLSSQGGQTKPRQGPSSDIAAPSKAPPHRSLCNSRLCNLNKYKQQFLTKNILYLYKYILQGPRYPQDQFETLKPKIFDWTGPDCSSDPSQTT